MTESTIELAQVSKDSLIVVITEQLITIPSDILKMSNVFYIISSNTDTRAFEKPHHKHSDITILTDKQIIDIVNTHKLVYNKIVLYENNFVFDSELYLSANPDVLQDNRYNTQTGSYKHWLIYGQKENRPLYPTESVLDFDPAYYLQKYPDLRKSGINTNTAARKHWVQLGEAEGREGNDPGFTNQQLIPGYIAKRIPINSIYLNKK
jgi:hypothetical protein